MLAQNFKSAVDLGISEAQKDALIKTLVLLETGKLRLAQFNSLADVEKGDRFFSGEFNMGTFGYRHKCGTIACIAGTAELISTARFIGVDRPEALTELFYMDSIGEDELSMESVTPAQAAMALRSYLTTGNANWRQALA